MKSNSTLFVTSVGVMLLTACSPQNEDGNAEMESDTEATVDTVTNENSEAGLAATPAETDASVEVCDEDGNRYASEEEAAATGLSEAQYGATYCEYIE